jgi:hypothetical protein
MTERSDDEDIAVLRKVTTLYVVDPVVLPRTTAPSIEILNAFPFSEVELGVREYRDLDDAAWTTFPRPTRAVEDLVDQRDSFNQSLRDLHESLFPPGTPVIPLRITEILATDGNPDAIEYLRQYAEQQRIDRLIALLSETGVDTVDVPTFFTPSTAQGPVQFPVRCAAANGDLHFTLPLTFVADLRLTGDLRPDFTSLTDPDVATKLHDAYTASRSGVIELPGVPIDLMPTESVTFADVPGSSELQSTIHEIRRLNIVGNLGSLGSYVPSLGLAGGDPSSAWAADIGVPTMRSLVGEDPTARIQFAEDYLRGTATDVALEIQGKVVDAVQNKVEDIVVDFTEMADRAGGLAAPKMVLNRISQVHGLINAEGARLLGAQESLDPSKLLSDQASLLGFTLSDVIKNVKVPPELKTITRDGLPNEVRMTWKDIDLQNTPRDAPMLIPLFPVPDPPPSTPPGANARSTVTIDVVSSPDSNETTCTVTNFKLRMPPGNDDVALIELTFAKVEFHQTMGKTPSLSVDVTNVQLLGKLKLLAELMEKVGGLDKVPIKVETAKDKIVARYSLPLPDVSAMSFVMSNLLFSAALTVPFNGDPLAIEIGFASRERPFTLTVLTFGGGGYVDLELIHTGLRRLEVSLQFGAAIGMNFGVGHAEVHAFGGIRYALVNHEASLAGYISIGGSLDVLGLVSVSIELRVELAYNLDTNVLVGRAKIVVDVDVTLFSDSFELDSGEWVIAGGSGPHRVAGPPMGSAGPPLPGPAPFALDPEPDDAGFAAWQAYRRAFE